MAPRTISVDPDAVQSNTSRITAHIEQLQAVSDAQVSHHTGPSVGVTAGFHGQLSGVAQHLPLLVEQLRQTLQDSQEAIKQTVAELTGKDASIAAEASAMLAGVTAVNNVPAPPAVQPATTGTAGASAASGIG
jgi:hypothetical protein